MVEGILSRISASNITVGITATLIPSTPLTGRKSIMIKNNGANIVYLGSSAVTSTTGYPLASGSEVGLDIGDKINIYGITSSGTSDIRILEGV